MTSGITDEKALENYRSLYTAEIIWNCYLITKSCETLFSLFSPTVATSPDFMENVPEAHEIIAHIYSAAGIINRLINPKSEIRGESNVAREFRKKRGEYLRTTLPAPIPEISKLRLRNSVEHIDENLDHLVRTLSNEIGPDYEHIMYNFVVSDRADKPNPIGKGTAPGLKIRVYVVSEETYINFDHELNLRKVYNEALSLQSIVETPGHRNSRLPAAVYVVPKQKWQGKE